MGRAFLVVIQRNVSGSATIAHITIGIEDEAPLRETFAPGTRPGDLIRRIAVAIGVLIAEGDEHLLEFFQRGGVFQAHVFQPHRVDEEAQRIHIHIAKGREAVDVAVRSGHGRLPAGIFRKHTRQRGRVLIDEVVERHEQLLGNAILHQLVGIKIVSQYSVRQVAAVAHHGDALFRGHGIDQRPIDGQPGFPLEVFRHRVVFDLEINRRTLRHKGDVHFKRLRYNRHGGFGVHHFRAGAHSQEQAKSENEGCEFFHGIPSFDFYCVSQS